MAKYARRDQGGMQAIEARAVLPRDTLVRMVMLGQRFRRIAADVTQKPLTDRDIRGAIHTTMQNLTRTGSDPLLDALDGPDSVERDAALLLYAWVDSELVRLGVFDTEEDSWITRRLAEIPNVQVRIDRTLSNN